MVNRTLFRLWTCLSTVALLIILAFAQPIPADARVYYTLDDKVEGDPGDGVLNPAATGDDSGVAIEGSAPAESGAVSTSSRVFSPYDVYLLPILVPGGLPGHGTVIFVPQAWSQLISVTPRLSDWGWHHAP